MSSSGTLQKHLKENHNITPFSTYLREIVYGGTDGIITTFAVVAGFAGAQSADVVTLPLLSVLLFGFANLFADGVSMALGSFLASRSEQDVYTSEQLKEQLEVKDNPKNEVEETIILLKQKGFSDSQSKTLTEIYATNPTYWVEFMMREELSLANPAAEKPHVMALITFVSFVSFGLLPLIPYVVARTHSQVFLFSVLMTGGALLLLGYLRFRVTKQSVVRALGESLLLGGIAASVAYIVGTLVKI